jgi:DNA-directed RNA polymerase subunit H (RpoH/RPB5)
MEEISQDEKNNNKKYPIIFLIVIIAILIIVGFFLYTNIYNITPQKNILDKEIFSEGEKLKILESLSADPDTIPSIEDRRKILNSISNNKPADAYEYSEEDKLQILRALQE